MKRLSFIQKALLIAFLLICASLFFMCWYKDSCALDSKNTYNINPLNLEGKLLIATSGSPFKDSITALVLNHYKSTSVVVEELATKSLETINITDYNAILILHRWEADKPSKDVQSFIDNNPNLDSKLVMLTTSWNGLEKIEGVDAITGASIVEDAPGFTDKIIQRLDRLLEK